MSCNVFIYTSVNDVSIFVPEKIPKPSKGCNQKKVVENKKDVKSLRKDNQHSGPTVKTKKKDDTGKKILKKAVTTLNSLNSRKLRITSQRIVENDSKNTRFNRSIKGKALTRSSIKTVKEVSSTKESDELLSSTKSEQLPPLDSIVENKRETRSGSGQSECSKKPDVKATVQKNPPVDSVLLPSKVNKTRKPIETKPEFVDSDEEPLGKMIIQSLELSSKVSAKKVKKLKEDDELQTSKGDSSIPVSLKTRKQTSSTPKENSDKEAVVISPQLVTRRRQSLLNTSSVINDSEKDEPMIASSLSSDCSLTIEKPIPAKKKLETIGKSTSLENIAKKPVVNPKALCKKIAKDNPVLAKNVSSVDNSHQNKMKEDIVKSDDGENENKTLTDEKKLMGLKKKSIVSNKLLKSSESVQKIIVKEKESLQIVIDPINKVVPIPSQSSSLEESQTVIDEKKTSKESLYQRNKLKSKCEENSTATNCSKGESKNSVLLDLSKIDESNSEKTPDCKDVVMASQSNDKKSLGASPKVPSISDSLKTSSELDNSLSRSPKKEKKVNLLIDNTLNFSEKDEIINSESKQSNCKVEAKISVTSELDTKDLKKNIKSKDKAITSVTTLKEEICEDKSSTSGKCFGEESLIQTKNSNLINKEKLKKTLSFPDSKKILKSVNSGKQVVINDIKVPELTITKDNNTLLTNEQPKNSLNASKVEIQPIKIAEKVTLLSTISTKNDSKQYETNLLSKDVTATIKDKSQNSSGKEKVSTINANVSFQDSSKLQDVIVKKCSEMPLSPIKTLVAIQQSYEPPSLPKTKSSNKGMVNVSPGKNLTQVKNAILEDMKSKVNEPKSPSGKRGSSESKVELKQLNENLVDKAKLEGCNSSVENSKKNIQSQLSEDVKLKLNEPKSASGKRVYYETKVDFKPLQESFFDNAQPEGSNSLVNKPNKQLIMQGFTDVKQEVKEQYSTFETKKCVSFDVRDPINEESCYDPKSAIDSYELSDKISSAVDSLMSLQNLKKIDEKIDYVYPIVSSLKNIKNVDTEQKKHFVQEFECKRVENTETKRVKFLDTDNKCGNFIEPDVRRSQVQENDFRRVQFQDLKPKPVPYQVLKGCSNPKSMLKPGTLIDIAGISHSPEIMTPLRPGSDGEIIPMNRPIKSFPDQFRMGVPGSRPYEPRMEQNVYIPRWQTPSQSGLRPEQIADKEAADSKSKAPVNDVWRHAFKNVKDPKSNNNIPVENPVIKKQLSLTSLAKKHNKTKTDVVGNDKNNLPNQSIPFLRQNKPVSDGSPNMTVSTIETISVIPEPKKSNVGIDLSSLREKEAEFVRQYITGELVNSVQYTTPITTLNSPTSVSDVNQIGISELDPVKSFTISSPSSTNQYSSYSLPEQVTSVTIQLLPPTRPASQAQSKSSSAVFCDNTKRASSPSSRYNKQILESGLSFIEPTSVNRAILSVNTSTDQSSQSLDICKDGSSKSSPKLHSTKTSIPDDSSKESCLNKIILPHQTIIGVVNPPKIEPTTPLSSFSQQFTSDSVFKQIQSKVSQASPTRNLSNQGVSGDNLFKDTNITRKTHSPTLTSSHSQHGSPISSMQSNSIKRNSNSPVAGRCSKNIFKEVVPATRSYSPTFSSASQSDDSLNNIFSQNPSFKRSISPLCNKPPFTAVSGSANLVEELSIDKTVSSSDLKEFTANSQNSLNINLKPKEKSYASVSSTSIVGMVTQTSASLEPSEDNSLTAEKQSFFNVVEKGPWDDIKTTGVHSEQYKDIKQDLHMRSNVKNQTLGLQHVAISESLNEAEVKHHLPLPVEQTLKKLTQPKPPNKKTFLANASNSSENKIINSNAHVEVCDKEVLSVTSPKLSKNESVAKTNNPVASRLSTGIYSHSQEGELDLMLNKKVNMSAEEIKRWLNEGTRSQVEHNVNCGHLENNTCECEYRNITPLRQQTSGIANVEKFEGLTSVTTNQQKNQLSANCNKEKTSPQIKKTVEAKSVPSTKNRIDSYDSGTFTKNMEIATEFSKNKGLPKLEGSKVKLQSDSVNVVNKISANVVKEVCQVPSIISNSKTPTKHSQSVEALSEFPITPPGKKVFKLSTKHVNPERDACLDMSGVSSPPLRDDVSSSNFSSSNEETPDKLHHEKRSIFQRRSMLKVKEKEPVPQNTNAFSPENESSVYAFEPDLPPTSAPFRRSKGKDGRSMNTTDEDEPAHSSSNSIAVQVNFDNEAVLECSTQTDVQEGDDDDTHTFYIPLQQSGADTTKSTPLIQGVAVTVDSEGPDQKVIMRAKLVTKPLSTFNRTSSSPSR